MADPAAIVFVDDSESELTLGAICHGMSSQAHPLRTFLGGAAFLEHIDAIEADGEPAPYLVLLDINMFGLGGLDVLERLHSGPSVPAYPILMLTNSKRPDVTERALALGAREVLRKPSGIDAYVELFDRLGEFVEQDR